MNKKELAKLLFQHKDIKSLFESRQFDASTLRKVISEEIMRENEENESYLKELIAQLKTLKASHADFKKRIATLGTVGD